jgi:hypothetical protein
MSPFVCFEDRSELHGTGMKTLSAAVAKSFGQATQCEPRNADNTQVETTIVIKTGDRPFSFAHARNNLPCRSYMIHEKELQDGGVV